MEDSLMLRRWIWFGELLVTTLLMVGGSEAILFPAFGEFSIGLLLGCPTEFEEGPWP